MTPHARRTPARAGRTAVLVGEALVVLVAACLAAGLAWLIARDAGISLVTGAVLGLLGALWVWRTSRTAREREDGDRADGLRGTDSRPIAEERRRRGQGGAFDQPGTSGFGTPGLGG